jgi:hypothetical protein
VGLDAFDSKERMVFATPNRKVWLIASGFLHPGMIMDLPS